MIIMGIDLGTVRTGISLCDKNGILAYPFCVLNESNSEELLKKIIEICESEKVEKIVIGYPKNMNGTIGESALRSEKLKKILCENLEIEVILWDERLTTVCSQKNFLKLNINSKKQKKIIDSSSSTFLLQNYLDYYYNKQSFESRTLS